MQTLETDKDGIVQTTTGRSFKLRTTPASDWRGEWPTERIGDVLVTETPGSCDGSIFVYWVGCGLTLDSPGVRESIQHHLDDHDVVGVRVVYALPDQVHSSLKADLLELQERSRAASGVLGIREGVTVRVKRNQGRIGGDKFPGRVGVVQTIERGSGDYCYVNLAATARAAARKELFQNSVLEVLTRPDEADNLPPMTGKQFATQLEACGSIVFAGASYVLLQHQVDGKKEGWAVQAVYPGGAKRMFGERQPLTRALAVHLASDDAIDWFLNRREASK